MGDARQRKTMTTTKLGRYVINQRSDHRIDLVTSSLMFSMSLSSS